MFFLPLFTYYQNEAGNQFLEEHKQNLATMIDADLSQYAIKGSEKDWKDAVKGNSKSVISVKR